MITDGKEEKKSLLRAGELSISMILNI